MNPLENARKSIDQIDDQIAALFEDRMKCVQAVAAYKKEHNLPVLDASREKKVLEKARERITDEELKDLFAAWMDQLMALSRKKQSAWLAGQKVAYCGVEGAFAHSAARGLFEQAGLKACSSFEEVFAAVENGEVDYGVLPLENTYSGMVGEVLDGLMRHTVYIQQAADIPIRQCLLGLPGSSLRDVRWVYSKDQALWQTQTFLKALGVETIPYPNTAMAAQYVAKLGDPAKAAIGSRENAELYGLEVLAENIESDPGNTTRFLVIGPQPASRPASHSSFLMILSNEPGSLAKAINVIAAFGLNMNCLQSRPRKGHPFEYCFYVQTEGVISPQKMDACLKALLQVCLEIKWLGTYSLRKDEER